MNTIYKLYVLVAGEDGKAKRVEIIPFASLWASKQMARKYFECADVIDVRILDEDTGEVMFQKDSGGEYEARES